MSARYDFASDNVVGAMPEVMAALAQANDGTATSYGGDATTARASDLIRELLDADAEVRFATSGTAANALAIAALVGPHEAVLCHEHSHVASDEAGAPGFFSAGAGLMTLPGAAGRIDPNVLGDILDQPDISYRQSPAALSLTNATEFGVIYAEADLAALTRMARGRGVKLHLDGARLSNAVAAGFDIKSLRRLDIDIAVLGGTKAGSTPSEAVVFFDKSLGRRLDARLKHAGQLVSKTRFLSAPWIGMLEGGAWTTRAAHANAMARRLAERMPFPLTYPVEANGVFVSMDEPALKRLRKAGWFVYRFLDGSVRFMCSWATTSEAVDELGAALAAVA
jgi:threonine aldolase